MNINEYLPKEVAEARTAAIDAIKSYQARVLTGGDLQDALRILLKGGTDSGKEIEWFHPLFQYHSLIMELLKLVSTPEINAQMREYHRKDAGAMLVELAEFFDELKHNRAAEAAMQLHYLENYGNSVNDLDHLRALTAEYESKTDDCRSDTVLVIG